MHCNTCIVRYQHLSIVALLESTMHWNNWQFQIKEICIYKEYICICIYIACIYCILYFNSENILNNTLYNEYLSNAVSNILNALQMKCASPY